MNGETACDHLSILFLSENLNNENDSKFEIINALCLSLDKICRSFEKVS